ncbi:MAG: DNA-directed RNA polymerase subunit omega [Clostridia bacterium]|jgi:DNA-directed RNA polymerase subunit K/omega|nr:DNA-directed RNA polymerase subunit omega [Clostridia bacterium]MBO7503976.1 DNA-directed RNA polymerase subunit omega [Clostridia bacterium]MBO7658278.1 DNA-directed RNA polymerase subunit omega [Clostridia bacterium]MBP5766136.1 DNA-directed RNA polymerase subunit omega [Clostridia bacterium]
MIEPEIAKLLSIDGIDSRFTLCAVVSKRARQLTDELHAADRDCKDVPEKKLSLEHGKAVAEAVYELYDGKLEFTKLDPAE